MARLKFHIAAKTFRQCPKIVFSCQEVIDKTKIAEIVNCTDYKKDEVRHHLLLRLCVCVMSCVIFCCVVVPKRWGASSGLPDESVTKLPNRPKRYPTHFYQNYIITKLFP
jgi:hypothetical protein